ncbi:hypothetical protein HK102_014174 [Quaeritorhiza haematococci]|nr:hypothetical protein HK102_014174 [Quaeritorhiza haematococci]
MPGRVKPTPASSTSSTSSNPTKQKTPHHANTNSDTTNPNPTKPTPNKHPENVNGESTTNGTKSTTTASSDTPLTHYQVLGVSQEATIEEVKKAYKREALKWHPDKNLDRKEEAEKRFREVAAAYEVLSSEQKRAEYDRRLSGEVSEDEDVFFHFPSHNFGGFSGFSSGFMGMGGMGSSFGFFMDPFDLFNSFFYGQGSTGRSSFGGFAYDDDDDDEDGSFVSFSWGFNDDDDEGGPNVRKRGKGRRGREAGGRRNTSKGTREQAQTRASRGNGAAAGGTWNVHRRNSNASEDGVQDDAQAEKKKQAKEPPRKKVRTCSGEWRVEVDDDSQNHNQPSTASNAGTQAGSSGAGSERVRDGRKAASTAGIAAVENIQDRAFKKQQQMFRKAKSESRHK